MSFIKDFNEPINEVASHKHLGIYLSNDGTWHEYITLLLKLGPGYILCVC